MHDERCAQMRSAGERRLCTPDNRAIGSVHKGAQDWLLCTKRHSGNRQLCTPLDNCATTSVHKPTPAMGYCAHHLWRHWLAVCTRSFQQWATVHTTRQSRTERCAHSYSGDAAMCTLPAKCTTSGVYPQLNYVDKYLGYFVHN